MTKNQTIILSALRIAFGSLFLYAGLSKIFAPEWSAAGYLKGAKTFPEIYGWLASPGNIGWVNFLNEWGLTLIGAALLLGFMTRIASFAGIALMALYYLPVLDFPFVGDHSFLVDEHVIYAAGLAAVAAFDAGKYWGLDGKITARK